MPGNVKRGANTGTDPDPSPYLFVSAEEKAKTMEMPYDPKRSCWVPVKDGGFEQGIIDSTEGDKVTVKVNKEKKILKKDQVQQVNPPKFEKCEDMSNLTYLNDASVLHNLKERYISQLIYTYSGLFCVAINPYKRFPIYTERTISLYINKRRNEVPPHIYAIADGSYQSMLTHSKNQSILITGESGAGKTENTKKVIGYFACVGSTGKSLQGKASLEDQVVQTNPILEAFGNAKTVRNDNSSRFGKFIRIHFNQTGKLSGADMEVYLLEKSRITFQQPLERSYHIFYNMMSDAVTDLKKNCLLSDNIFDYHFVSQGKVSVESIDDKEDMMFADEAFNILGFSKQEICDVYKVTACVMHLGEITFKKKSSKDDQAVPDKGEAGNKVAALLGVDSDILLESFVQPKIKVGSEWVTKGQNVAQTDNAVSGIARAIFEKQFRYLVSRCNETLVDPSMRRITFIGVLDIAGFEIFDFNGFEQICINFCNEKLQQFFNHHMFVLEQEEYLREGIEWAMVDFGMDLQKCIDMFEKPLGVLSILEEESLFPKATDKTFEEKLYVHHLGKSPTFVKAKAGGPDKDAHFAVVHYAGTVSYNLTNWLEKNKDPLNDTVIDLFKRGTNELIVEVFRYHPGQSGDEVVESGGKKKKGGGKTVSSFYKEQLINLMATLHATEPHFIRCIVPNTHKLPGVIDSPLVMHQLTCNGVLEGIRICRKGFPNRMPYHEFKERYNILAAKMMSSAKTDKIAAKDLFGLIGLESERYRLGHTKVFFRAGVLGLMEEIRDNKIAEILTWLQSSLRGTISRVTFKKMQAQKLALYCVQRSIKNFMVGKTWLWWQIWTSMKPKLISAKFAQIKESLEAKTREAESRILAEIQARKAAGEINESLERSVLELEESLASGASTRLEMEGKAKKIEEEKKNLDKQVSELERRLTDENEACAGLSNALKRLENDSKRIKEEMENMENRLQQTEDDKVTKDFQIRAYKEELQSQEDLVIKLNKEKKGLCDSRQVIEDNLTAAEDKANHLNRLKAKLEQSLDEVEDSVEREKKVRNEIEKCKRKLEGDLKITQESLSDLERVKTEILNAVQRKEKEMSAIAAKIEDEQSVGNKLQKQMQELSTRLVELEEELETERVLRSKSEKGRQILTREIEELGEKLEESGNATTNQIECNRKREAELIRLKEELDSCGLNHENALSSLRTKHNAIISELGDEIDKVNKSKAVVEQQKNSYLIEMNDLRAAVDELSKEKNNIERHNKQLNTTLAETNSRLEQCNSAISESESMKKKLCSESEDLDKQNDEAEKALREIKKLKTSLSTQLEDTRRMADAETRDRSTLLSKFKNLEIDLEALRDKIQSQNEEKAKIQKRMSRALSEATLWKTKFTTEAVARIEDLENARTKISARISEAEDCIEGLQSKVASTEKLRNRYQIDLEDLQIENERVNGIIGVSERKIKTFDKVVDEWKSKVYDLSFELEASGKESRNASTELFRLKNAWDEINEQSDSVRRENKNLADEIKDLLEQLGEGGRSIHELDKQRKKLLEEKDELASALEDAEAALEMEENKVLAASNEIYSARQEIEKRLLEKEEEFENTRRNFGRALDSLQVSLEGEMKSKQEALRMKKKIESDINELEMTLDHANKTNVEASKQIKRQAATLLEVTTALEEEIRLRAEIQDLFGISERKGNVLASELTEAQMLLETSERGRRNIETEVSENREALNDLSNNNAHLSNTKRRIESELRALLQETEDLSIQAKNGDEKARKAILDSGRLADELRSEQDHGIMAEKGFRASEAILSELQGRLENVEASALKHGKKVIGKLEDRIRSLDNELNTTQNRSNETHKAALKSDRAIKEMQFNNDENKKNIERMTELIEKLQGKIRTYKKQIEDAEEIAALNLAKYRKAQQALEEAEERSSHAEGSMTRLRGQSLARDYY